MAKLSVISRQFQAGKLWQIIPLLPTFADRRNDRAESARPES
jgi:hypothetical protein